MSFDSFRPIRLDSPTPSGGDLLARFDFGEATAADTRFRVPLAHLAGPAQEAWIPASGLREAQHGDIVFRHDGRWLMGMLQVEVPSSQDIEQAAFDAYRALQDFMAVSPCPNLLRVWNFLDRLNEGEGDAERYRRFCVGRHRAIARPGFEARLPAATVIGSRQPGLVLHFLAASERGTQVENPRQTPAFHYPRDYGPISPSFSRATRLGRHLLVSGTAAVVGHATLHPGDATAQAGEIDANVGALLEHAARTAFPGQPGRWWAQALRIYLRRPADQSAVLPKLLGRLDAGTPVTVLRGDISRSDLMVEIEGVWSFEPRG